MTAKIKLASHLLPEHGIRLDPISDEVYIVRSPREDIEDVNHRLAQRTKSYDSKLYPWMKQEEKVWKKAVIVNRNPTFQTVSANKALSISERLSRPTKATLLRSVDEDGNHVRETSAGSNRPMLHRSATFSHGPRSQVPSASARPDRPILRSSSRQKKSHDTGNSGSSLSRNVRFQSPLPPVVPASASQTRTNKTSKNNDSNNSSGKTTNNSPSSPKKTNRDTESTNTKDSHKIETHNTNSRNGTDVEKENRSKLQTEKNSKDKAEEESTKENLKSSTSLKSNSNSTVSSENDSAVNSRQNSATKRQSKKSRSGKRKSLNHSNMEMVLDYFSEMSAD